MNKSGWIIPSIIAVVVIVAVVALWSNTDNEYGWAVQKIAKPISNCVWCGGSCVLSRPGLKCTNNNPVSGFSCSLVNNTCRAVPIDTCTDSDGGKNYAVAGTVIYNGIAYPDSCTINSSALDEMYCENNVAKGEIHVCGTGSTCQNGACVAVPSCISEGGKGYASDCCSGLVHIYALLADDTCDTLISGNPGYCTKCGDGVCKSPENKCSCPADCAPKPSCTDSDGGADYYASGTVVGLTSNNVNYTNTDFCSTSSTLVEWFCSGVYNANKTYACPYGCLNGACINSTNSTGCKVVPSGCVCTGNDVVVCP